MTIKIAYHPSSRGFLHIDKAQNGLKCDCECIECGELLEARQGGKREWHFKHHVNVNCTGSQETALHELAKQILVDHEQIEVPGKGQISYFDAVAEKRLEKLRPDVSALYNGAPIYFEVFVSNAVDAGKEKFLIEGKHRCVEIDLSRCLELPFSAIKSWVLDKVENKKVIYWEDEPINEELIELPKSQEKIQSKTKSENGDGLWLIVIMILVFLGLRKSASGKSKKYKSRY